MKEEKEKCKLILDHNPVWAGDGYFCSRCGLQFVPITEKQKWVEEIENEISQIKLDPLREKREGIRGHQCNLFREIIKKVAKIKREKIR